MSHLPQFPQSYWTSSAEIRKFPKVSEDLSADVVIAGAGITGITAGYLLSMEGKKVIILDAGRTLHGTTGHTTAKITAQHDLIYDEFLHHLGEEKTRMYYDANMEALSFIRETVNRERISCGFTEELAYIYAESDQALSTLNKEWKAYEKLGIASELVERIDLPLQVKAALVMKNQAQFNPVQYLNSLIDQIVKSGSELFELTTVVKVENGDSPYVVTDEGHRITGKHIISASHFPFADWKGFYFARMHAERSYVLGIRANQGYPGGMYLSAEEPKRSIRSVQTDGEELILVGGEGHKAGQSPRTIEHYEALESFANQLFDVKEVAYRWSTQDLVTLDKLPFIGQMSAGNPNLYIATGYRKWGMTNGTAAALLLKDMILGKGNRYEELYDPSRFYPDPAIKHFVMDNVDVAKNLISGKLEMVHRSPEDVGNDEGAVVRVNGKRAGAYRDKDGVLHLVDTTCTHMGCETKWNDGDRTWDCPCHGSRFSFTGEVIEGPAKKPLHKMP